ncbi:MAG: DMT family transporter [Cyanobium sp.]
MLTSNPWLLLTVAIVAEVLGTAFLKLSAGMTRPVPTLVVLVAFSIAIILMAKVVEVLPLGLTYAVWTGIGVVATVVVGILAYQQIPTTSELVGMALIVAGVAVVNLSSALQG